jgi:NADPH:quinone reductase-like Zn-dependent oxidoreductase
MKYKSLLVTARGGLEAVQIVENELRPPSSGEARLRILATPVCQDDVAVRVGNRPFLPKIPFVPGYSMLGAVDAIGEGVSQVKVGDRVAALTQLGSHAEYIYLDASNLVPVPEDLDPAEAVVLILNYLVPHQVLHHVLPSVQAGEAALVVGASGGVGTAFLQLGKLAQLKMYGLASPGKNSLLTKLSAIPIDYHKQNFVQVLRAAEPAGIDYVFNGMGEEYFAPGLKVLRRGGVLVHYGGPQSFARFLLLMVEYISYNLLPNGKKIIGYGTHTGKVSVFKEDWSKLFTLLAEGQIKPIIAGKFPLLEAPQAYALLESGQVAGNLVLLAPDLWE